MNNDIKSPFPIHVNVQNIKGPKGDKGEPGKDGKSCECSINFCSAEDILEMFK